MMVIWEEETHGFGRMQRELRKARGLRRRRRVQPPDHGTHRHRHRRLCEGRAGGAGRRGFSPARGCFCVAHLRPSRRKVEAATGRRRDHAYWAFAFDEVARPTRERERERLLPGYTRTDLKAISQLTRTVVPYRRRRPAYNERPTTPRHRAACGVFASLLAHFLPSRTEKPFTPR